MLYSLGKDSSVMLRLAQKAIYPGKPEVVRNTEKESVRQGSLKVVDSALGYLSSKA